MSARTTAKATVDAVDAVIGDPNRGLDPYVGNTYRGKIIAPLTGTNSVVSHIDVGVEIAPVNGIITYGFFTGNHAVSLNNSPKFGEGKGYSPFTAVQEAAAVKAITLWDELIPETFVNVGDVDVKGWAHNDATILLANTTTGPAQAWAYYPGYNHQYTRVSSDVWIAEPEFNGSNGWLRYGGYGETTLIHELGHTLGLSHPGAYNFGPGFAVTYANGAEYAQDSKEYTIMSYWSDRETGALVTTWNVFLAGQPQTPMIHDIYTIQSKYGADLTTRAGDTTYGFNTTAGINDVYNFQHNPYPMLSIYDASGAHDKIDLSGFTVGQFLDLHAGSFSSIGGAPASLAQTNIDRAQWNVDSGSVVGDPYYLAPITVAAYNDLVTSRPAIITGRILATTGVAGITATEFDNFSIAYGTTIEDATGGSARDLLWGNEVANIIHGGGGDDVIDGFEGADTLYGDAGNDTFKFHNMETGDRIMDWNAGDKIDLTAFGHLTFIGGAAFSAAGQVHYTGGVLSADINGDGIADFGVTLATSPILGASDLLLI